MAGNVKALTPEEMKVVLQRFSFESSGDYVITKANNRSTAHLAKDGFSLLLPLERRRIRITPLAISMWQKKHSGKYSLLEVQNAINTLLVTLQPTTEGNVEAQLKRARCKLDNLFKEGE